MLTNLRKLNKLLPLVAIGTVADCQSVLEPTNRLLVRSGLQILNSGHNEIQGLNDLLEQTGFNDKMSQGYKMGSQDLAFILSPILNSSGRISHAKLSISTLLDNENSATLGKKLIQTNHERKELVSSILEDLDSTAETQYADGQKIIWLEGDWSKGIVGLLASRLVNRYDLPVIVVSVEEDKASASLRAPSGFHLPKAMNAVQEIEELFEKSGGHPGAAGFTTKSKNLVKIKELMSQELGKQGQNFEVVEADYVPEGMQIPVELDPLRSQKNLIWLNLDEVTPTFLKEITLLDPYGQDFPYPFIIFKTSSFTLRWMGQEQNHTKITFNITQTATLFRVDEQTKKDLIQGEIEGRGIWLMAKISQNTWNGKTSLELIAEKCWVL
ncbi:MAG: DHHA1 domain-containing protein [bacterium]